MFMQIHARQEPEGEASRRSPGAAHDFPRMWAARDKTRRAEGQDEKRACSRHKAYSMEKKKKTQVGTARRVLGMGMPNRTGTRAARRPKHMQPLGRSTVRRDPAP